MKKESIQNYSGKFIFQQYYKGAGKIYKKIAE